LRVVRDTGRQQRALRAADGAARAVEVELGIDREAADAAGAMDARDDPALAADEPEPTPTPERGG